GGKEACLYSTVNIHGDMFVLFSFFFFQAEDGIRDRNVTGVQTCALPIWTRALSSRPSPAGSRLGSGTDLGANVSQEYEQVRRPRSEERRVGKEWRSRGAT